MEQMTTKTKIGYFLMGMFGFLPGVFVAWLVGSDGGSWALGGKKWAWIGCLVYLLAIPLLITVSGLIAGTLGLVAPGVASFHYDF